MIKLSLKENVPYGKYVALFYGWSGIHKASTSSLVTHCILKHDEMERSHLLVHVESFSKADFHTWACRLRDALAMPLITPQIHGATPDPCMEEAVRSSEAQELHTPLLLDRM